MFSTVSLDSARESMGFFGYFNGFGGRDMAVDLGRRTRSSTYADAASSSGAVRGRDRRALRRGPRRRRRGEADARPYARHDLRDPPAEGRRHRRLRRHGADAPPLHPEGAPAPLRSPARRGLRPLRRHRSREARRRGSHALSRRQRGAPDRGADGRSDRRRPPGLRADREHDRRRRRRHHRGRRHLPRRHRRLADPSGSAATRWTRRSSATSRRSTSS